MEKMENNGKEWKRMEKHFLVNRDCFSHLSSNDSYKYGFDMLEW